MRFIVCANYLYCGLKNQSIYAAFTARQFGADRIPPGSLPRLEFDGRLLPIDKTPAQMDMEEDDLIDVKL